LSAGGDDLVDHALRGASPTGRRSVQADPKNPVLRGDYADTLVVSAVLPDDGVGLFLADLTAPVWPGEAMAPYDGLRGAQVEFAAAAAEPLGDGGDASVLIVGAQVRAQAGLCAEAVGAMEAVLRLTSEIPAQAAPAVRHPVGEVPDPHPTCRRHVRVAGVGVQHEPVRDHVTGRRSGRPAHCHAGQVADRLRSTPHWGQEAIQMRGGIGMTAEYPTGHYVSRLTAIGHTLGSTDDHLRVLAGDISDHDATG
jgi:alkylation response protein AidB-like acyl-CoA dehydrogenase